MNGLYSQLEAKLASGEKQLAVLIDPDKFNDTEAEEFIKRLPEGVTHIFVGGSTVEDEKTALSVTAVKKYTNLPVILFPGSHTQITDAADGILFLSLISGRNPEYLIEQQVRSVQKLRDSKLEIIPTGYVLIDGGKECAVQRVSNTRPIPQTEVETVVHTSLAGQFSGKKLIYLEAGSGALKPVSEEIVGEVKKAINIPLIVGGGIRSREQLERAFKAGADLVVIGTAFENGGLN
ncbi:geranylgeranylglyceryl/heptaprenylglyceryl phosphate synthase [Salegentibacter chungangensis]|uniref:Geranylgeranylglyceryl phosphate synthase n=1 Tax=Salegentibacter chungangensis TaxID=1335724 RepID=A0ABW3NP01_9FLAO